MKTIIDIITDNIEELLLTVLEKVENAIIEEETQKLTLEKNEFDYGFYWYDWKQNQFGVVIFDFEFEITNTSSKELKNITEEINKIYKNYKINNY